MKHLEFRKKHMNLLLSGKKRSTIREQGEKSKLKITQAGNGKTVKSTVHEAHKLPDCVKFFYFSQSCVNEKR